MSNTKTAILALAVDMSNTKTAILALACALSASSAFAMNKPVNNDGKNMKINLVGDDAKNLKALLDGVSPRGTAGDDLYYFYSAPLGTTSEAKWSISCSTKPGANECEAGFGKDLVENSAGQAFLMNAYAKLGNTYGYSETFATLRKNAAGNAQATVSGDTVTFTSRDGQLALACSAQDCRLSYLKSKTAPGRYGDLALHMWGHKALTGVASQDRRIVVDLKNDADVAALLDQAKNKYAIEPSISEKDGQTTSTYVVELTPDQNHTNVLACSETSENGRVVGRRCRIRVVSYYASNYDVWDPVKNVSVSKPYLFGVSASGLKVPFKTKDGSLEVDCFSKKNGYCMLSFVNAK